MSSFLLLCLIGPYCFCLRTQCIIIKCKVGCSASLGCTLVKTDAKERPEKTNMNSGNVITDIHIFSDKKVKATHKNLDEFLLAVSYGYKKLEVMKRSVTSNTTLKTGIKITGYMYSIVYDRETDTVFWSTNFNIMKGKIGESVSHVYVKLKDVFDMRIYKDQIIYITKKYIGMVSKLSPNDTPHIWYSPKRHQVILHFSLDNDLICWIQQYYYIFCATLPSNKTQKLLTSESTLQKVAVISLQNCRMIVFANKKAINVTLVNTDSNKVTCSKEENLERKIMKLQSFIMIGNVLYYTYVLSVKFEARHIFKNCSVREIFSWEYNGKHSKYSRTYMTTM